MVEGVQQGLVLVGTFFSSPKRHSSVWMSSWTCPCALLKSWRVGA